MDATISHIQLIVLTQCWIYLFSFAYDILMSVSLSCPKSYRSLFLSCLSAWCIHTYTVQKNISRTWHTSSVSHWIKKCFKKVLNIGIRCVEKKKLWNFHNKPCSFRIFINYSVNKADDWNIEQSSVFNLFYPLVKHQKNYVCERRVVYV